MDYTVERYNNGTTTANSVYTLTGTIAFGDVLVIANSQRGSHDDLAQADVIFPGETHF